MFPLFYCQLLLYNVNIIRRSEGNKKSKNNPQEIRWIFKIDKNKLKKGVPYEICYIISVPGLAALQNGSLKKDFL